MQLWVPQGVNMYIVAPGSGSVTKEATPPCLSCFVVYFLNQRGHIDMSWNFLKFYQKVVIVVFLFKGGMYIQWNVHSDLVI